MFVILSLAIVSPCLRVWGNQPPVAFFTYSPADPYAQETITFDASAACDPDGSIISYHWDFGDSNTPTVTAPLTTHAYVDCGSYTVTLTVTDNEGLTSSTSHTVPVINPDKLRIWADAGSYVGSNPDGWIKESWVVTNVVPAGDSVSFNLYLDAISNPSGADPTYDVYLAVAINDTAQVASITVGPTIITTFTYGSVTWPEVAGGGTPPPHSVYPTYYALASFGDVASDLGYHTTPGTPYGPYWAYRAHILVTITTRTAVDAGFKIHFDAQGVLVKGSTSARDRNSNSFSHDLTCEGAFSVLHPAIDVSKSGPAYAHEGDLITYTISVTNTGDCPLVGVSVTDTLLGLIWNGNLGTGVTMIFTKTYTVPHPSTVISNTVTATGSGSGTVSDTASWVVTVLHPGIDVTNAPDKTTAHEGDLITYTISVTNTGDCPLVGVSVTDTLLGLIWTGNLGTEVTMTFTKTYTVPHPSTVIANTVTASGCDVLGGVKGTVSDTASCIVGVTASPLPVGGEWVPINKSALVAPWIGLASLMTVVTVSFVYVERKKKQ